ncbi:MAG: hypothetical protein ACRDPY_30375 [Streptosporangiaceae bacterium]
MATQPYKITLNDGSSQVLPKVWRQTSDGPFLVFYDEDAEVHRVLAKDVKSVTRTDQPEPIKARAPRMGAV